MIKFWDFVEFLNMQQLGAPDTIVRNYSVETKYNRAPIHPSLKDDFVRLGLARLGLNPGNTNGKAQFGEVLAALRSKGCTLNETIIMAYLAHWFNYDRIKCGELKRWPKRDIVKAP